MLEFAETPGRDATFGGAALRGRPPVLYLLHAATRGAPVIGRPGAPQLFYEPSTVNGVRCSCSRRPAAARGLWPDHSAGGGRADRECAAWQGPCDRVQVRPSPPPACRRQPAAAPRWPLLVTVRGRYSRAVHAGERPRVAISTSELLAHLPHTWNACPVDAQAVSAEEFDAIDNGVRPSLGTAQRRVFHLLCSPCRTARVGGLCPRAAVFNRCRPAGIVRQPPDVKERWEPPPMAGTPKEECSSGRFGITSAPSASSTAMSITITCELQEHNPL